MNKNNNNTYGSGDVFNIALVTDEDEPCDSFEGIAERVLARLVTHDFSFLGQISSKDEKIKTRQTEEFLRLDGGFSSSDEDETETQKKAQRDDPDDFLVSKKSLPRAKQPTVSTFPLQPAHFVSKELAILNISDDFDTRIVLRIVRIPKFSASKNLQEDHPCNDDGALGKNNMPSLNGWNYILCCTPSAALWFQSNVLPKKTPAGALSSSERIFVPFNTARFFDTETTKASEGLQRLPKLKDTLFPSSSSSVPTSSVAIRTRQVDQLIEQEFNDIIFREFTDKIKEFVESHFYMNSIDSYEMMGDDISDVDYDGNESD